MKANRKNRVCGHTWPYPDGEKKRLQNLEPASGLSSKSVSGGSNDDDFLQGMATCHSLTLIEGKLSGDPLDVIMFEGINLYPLCSIDYA